MAVEVGHARQHLPAGQFMLLSGFCHCPDDAARECSKGFFSKRSVHGHAYRAPANDMELLANGLSKKKEAKY